MKNNLIQEIQKPNEKAETIQKKQNLSPLRQGQWLDVTETRNHMIPK